MSKYPKPSWKVRKRIIIVSLLFCAFCILWVLLNSNDSRPVYEIIVICSFTFGASIVGSYIFGAAWDDSNYMKALKPKEDITADQWETYSEED